MGTRFWTRFYRKASAQQPRKLVAVLYRQLDGYPEGAGRSLTACIKALAPSATAEEVLQQYMQQLSTEGQIHHVETQKVLDELEEAAQVRWIEWVYDVEEIENQGIIVSILPGDGWTQEPPWEVVKGTAGEVSKWIADLRAEGCCHFFNSDTRTIEKTCKHNIVQQGFLLCCLRPTHSVNYCNTYSVLAILLHHEHVSL